MAKLSIIIPNRAEKYENLSRTVESVFENALGDFEVLIGFDGPPYYDFKGQNIKVIKFPDVVGIKTNINALAALAKGQYLFKLDAHCRVGKGFDEILKSGMREEWIVMPRFMIIKEDWSIQERDGQEEFYDYFYLCCPFTDPRGFRFKAGGHWGERTKERDPYTTGLSKDMSLDEAAKFGDRPLVDETPQIHGSGWFISKDRYFKLGGFPNIDPYGHAQEPIWLAMKNWMAGGKVVVNKKTWYAHLHQQGNKRGYHMNKAQEIVSYDIAATYWVGDNWDDTWPTKRMSFEEFVDRFSPMPTWPEDWKERRKQWISKKL